MAIDVQAIAGNGWRQGSLFTIDATQVLLAGKRTHEASRLILASQDCDIVHRRNGEPFVDAFEAKPIRNIASTETKGRNVRQLHLPLVIQGQNQPHQILFWSRTSLPRDKLAEFSPDPHANLDSGSLRWFQRWLVFRYDRAALPDTFNARLEVRKARETIREILGSCQHCFTDLYLHIDPEDRKLTADSPYAVRVALIMSGLDAGRVDFVDLATQGRDALDTFLKSCPGIDVRSTEVISDTEFTLADLDTYRRWDFSDLSLPDAIS